MSSYMVFIFLYIGNAPLPKNNRSRTIRPNLRFKTCYCAERPKTPMWRFGAVSTPGYAPRFCLFFRFHVVSGSFDFDAQS